MSRHTKGDLRGFVKKGAGYSRPFGKREWRITHGRSSEYWRLQLLSDGEPIEPDPDKFVARTLAGAVRLAEFFEPQLRDSIPELSQAEAPPD